MILVCESQCPFGKISLTLKKANREPSGLLIRWATLQAVPTSAERVYLFVIYLIDRKSRFTGGPFVSGSKWVQIQ